MKRLSVLVLILLCCSVVVFIALSLKQPPQALTDMGLLYSEYGFISYANGDGIVWTEKLPNLDTDSWRVPISYKDGSLYILDHGSSDKLHCYQPDGYRTVKVSNASEADFWRISSSGNRLFLNTHDECYELNPTTGKTLKVANAIEARAVGDRATVVLTPDYRLELRQPDRKPVTIATGIGTENVWDYNHTSGLAVWVDDGAITIKPQKGAAKTVRFIPGTDIRQGKLSNEGVLAYSRSHLLPWHTTEPQVCIYKAGRHYKTNIRGWGAIEFAPAKQAEALRKSIRELRS